MTEFFHMGGHGFYIWACYGLAIVILAGLFANSLWESHKTRKELTMLEQLKKTKG